VCAPHPVPGVEGWECKIRHEMSVMDSIFGKWELAVTDDVYIKRKQYW